MSVRQESGQLRDGANSFFGSLAQNVLGAAKDTLVGFIDEKGRNLPIWTENSIEQNKRGQLRRPTYVGAAARPRMDQPIMLVNPQNAPPRASPALLDLNIGGTRMDGATIAIVAAAGVFFVWALFVRS